MALPPQLEQLIAQAQAHPPVMFVAGVALAAVLIALLHALRSALSGGGGGGAKSKKVFLDATKFQPLPLSKVDRVSHNTVRLTFDLPDPGMRLGLPIGQHITFLARDADGKDVYRPYTPVTDDDTLGKVEFVIKVYPQGKMSQVVDKMRVGDTMPMKGPRGRFAYARNQYKHIGERRGGEGLVSRLLSCVGGVGGLLGPKRRRRRRRPHGPTLSQRPPPPPPIHTHKQHLKTKQACSRAGRASPRCTRSRAPCSRTRATARACRSCTGR